MGAKASAASIPELRPRRLSRIVLDRHIMLATGEER